MLRIQTIRGNPYTMAYCEIGTDEDSTCPAELDPKEFSRQLREFAIDAHRFLKDPDRPIDDVAELHRRACLLLRGAPVAQSSMMHRWLLEVWGAINARIQSRPLAELESLMVRCGTQGERFGSFGKPVGTLDRL
jgi:hypothetical protein